MGQDIDGRTWRTTAFAEASLGLVEGLAQFYTRIVAERIREREPERLSAFDALLVHQSPAYHVHEEWFKLVARPSEIVRYCLIEARSKEMEASADFSRRRKR